MANTRWMAGGTRWGQTPKASIEAECRRRGQDAVGLGCAALLRGEVVDPALVLALGGPPAAWVLTGEDGGPAYWLRVWAARGLLWVWDDRAYPELETALGDASWRVREMAVRVVVRHQLSQAAPIVAVLRDDPVGRVASLATRALPRLPKVVPASR